MNIKTNNCWINENTRTNILYIFVEAENSHRSSVEVINFCDSNSIKLSSNMVPYVPTAYSNG